MVLGNGAGAVGVQQASQVVGLSLQLPTHICLRDLHPGLHPFKDQGVVGNVMVVVNGVPAAAEGLVGDDADVPGVVDQCI